MAHASVDSLVSKLALVAEAVRVGSRWRHYKTQNIYSVIELALDEETEEPCVVYQSPLSPKLKWIRTVSNFLEEVDGGEGKVSRFTLVD